MKSEHRHELKTNDLGKWATDVGESAKQYTNQILAGAIGVLLLAAVAFYWSKSSAASAALGWNEMAAARSAEEFANVADSNKGTVVGSWARLKEGEMHLDSGLRLAFSDRASGVSDLDKAKKCFDELINDPKCPADVKERALFGLGRTLETLSDRDTNEAMAAYERLVKDYPYTAYKTVANKRIEALRTGGAQEFYAWFHEQNPKPVDRELPRDMTLPEGSGETNDQPAADGDSAAGEEKSDGASEGNAGGESKPEDGDAKSQPDAAKSDEKPADSKSEATPPAKEE